jgi:hypothetical protein
MGPVTATATTVAIERRNAIRDLMDFMRVTSTAGSCVGPSTWIESAHLCGTDGTPQQG